MLSHMETQEADSAGEAPRIVAAQITPCPRNIHMHREPQLVALFLFFWISGNSVQSHSVTRIWCFGLVMLWMTKQIDLLSSLGNGLLQYTPQIKW